MAVFLWKQFPGHPRPTFGIPVCLSRSHTQNPHLPNTHFRRALLSSSSSIELDIRGPLRCLTGHPEKSGQSAARFPLALLALGVTGKTENES